jgi:hypothetical protein
MLLDNQQDGGYTVEENALENKVEEICEDCESSILDYEYKIYNEKDYTVIQIRRIDTGGPEGYTKRRGKEFAYENKDNFSKNDIYGVYIPEVEEGSRIPRIYVDK